MDELRRAIAAHQRATTRVQEAERRRDEAICAARATGASLRKLAAVCGISHQRVAQIVAR